ncbi:hypothetical protein HH303_19485 [Rhodospirillaceae bacterium KN72]|uniref:Putative DNA-binding domain-containing protein n=1 Tax=Pacificispira spongiicola TaxID=2729598 RepID=A0A7Y0E3P0_9PROT|nr:putative DNA-binding domain-containing protein [Pacificispira spongiicola]NMM46682.1 hypothetical protein [Pacificispira spongiicola]
MTRDLDHRPVAAAIRDAAQPIPASLAPGNCRTLPQRFAVYRNNFVVGLRQALADRFPTVRQLVGDDFFNATAHAYIDEEPPLSPIVAEYGNTFPDFLEHFPPAHQVPYLHEVARLESTYHQVLHAADEAVLSPDDFARMGDSLGARTFRFVQSCRLLSFRYAAIRIWQSHRDGNGMSGVSPDGPEFGMVTRPDQDVSIQSLDPATYLVLSALTEGATLNEAFARTVETGREPDLEIVLGRLVRGGIVEKEE